MRYRITYFTLQWHITVACDKRCRHCYMYDDSTYRRERERERTDRDLFRILERCDEFENDWQANIGLFFISGGDPLLRPGWERLLTELHRRRKRVVILGNPETLTDSNLERLAACGVSGFQVSLDGLESRHDEMRGPGSFRRTLAALPRLAAHGIPSQVMFTLHAGNSNDLIPLLRLVAEHTPAERFVFDQLSSVGNATGMAGRLTADELQALFTAYLVEKERLQRAGSHLIITEKPHLFTPLHLASGDRRLPSSPEVSVFGGCLAGWTSAAILADGTVLPCRRLPLAAGRLPEQSLADVFLGAEVMRQLRRQESFASCGTCDCYGVCRGCPAVAFGESGTISAKPSGCFRAHLPAATVPPPAHFPAPPLTADNRTEYEFVARHFANLTRANLHELLRSPDVQLALLATSPPDRHAAYIADPAAFAHAHHFSLNDLEREFVAAWPVMRNPALQKIVDPILFQRLIS
ncbi:MAG TPA: radical SAM protein [bacterium]|nr:radical SAM protein [bacterium]